MKVSIIITILSCIYMLAYTQAIPNGDFENYLISGNGFCVLAPVSAVSGLRAPVQTCSVKSGLASAWHTSHGTPELFMEGNGNTVLSLWSGTAENLAFDYHDGGHYGEGVTLQCPEFEMGKKYTLRFKMNSITSSGDVIDEVNIYLVKGEFIPDMPVSFSDPQYYKIPFVPASDKQLIFQELNFNNAPTNLQTFETTFYPNANYHTIWIYIDDSSEQDFVEFDDFEFVECEPGFKVFTTSSTFESIDRSEYILLKDNFFYTASNEVIDVAAGEYIGFLSTTEIVASEDGSVNFFIQQPCTFPDMFCWPNDVFVGEEFSESGEIPVNRDAIKFSLNDVEFQESRAILSSISDCFDVKVLDFSGNLIFQKDCVQQGEDLFSKDVIKDRFISIIVYYDGAFFLKKEYVAGN